MIVPRSAPRAIALRRKIVNRREVKKSRMPPLFFSMVLSLSHRYGNPDAGSASFL
jgi:hypothetical protein